MLDENTEYYAVGILRTSDGETNYLYSKYDGNGVIYRDDVCTGTVCELSEVAMPCGINNRISEETLVNMLNQNIAKGVCGYIALEDFRFIIFYYDKTTDTYSYAIGDANDAMYGKSLASHSIDIDIEVECDYD